MLLFTLFIRDRQIKIYSIHTIITVVTCNKLISYNSCGSIEVRSSFENSSELDRTEQDMRRIWEMPWAWTKFGSLAAFRNCMSIGLFNVCFMQ